MAEAKLREGIWTLDFAPKDRRLGQDFCYGLCYQLTSSLTAPVYVAGDSEYKFAASASSGIDGKLFAVSLKN